MTHIGIVGACVMAIASSGCIGKRILTIETPRPKPTEAMQVEACRPKGGTLRGVCRSQRRERVRGVLRPNTAPGGARGGWRLRSRSKGATVSSIKCPRSWCGPPLVRQSSGQRTA